MAQIFHVLFIALFCGCSVFAILNLFPSLGRGNRPLILVFFVSLFAGLFLT